MHTEFIRSNGDERLDISIFMDTVYRRAKEERGTVKGE
jgi:hypothetical protein